MPCSTSKLPLPRNWVCQITNFTIWLIFAKTIKLHTKFMQDPNAGPKPVATPKEKKIKEKTGSGKSILVGLYKKRSHLEVCLEKSVLKICSKFTGEHPCRSVMLIKLLCNFVGITLRHWCSPVKLLHIFRTLFLKNTSGRLVLETGEKFND